MDMQNNAILLGRVVSSVNEQMQGIILNEKVWG